jgi:hypothetical protein
MKDSVTPLGLWISEPHQNWTHFLDEQMGMCEVIAG